MHEKKAFSEKEAKLEKYFFVALLPKKGHTKLQLEISKNNREKVLFFFKS